MKLSGQVENSASFEPQLPGSLLTILQPIALIPVGNDSSVTLETGFEYGLVRVNILQVLRMSHSHPIDLRIQYQYWCSKHGTVKSEGTGYPISMHTQHQACFATGVRRW